MILNSVGSKIRNVNFMGVYRQPKRFWHIVEHDAYFILVTYTTVTGIVQKILNRISYIRK